jgi:LacI family transcriptional regulator
MNATVHDVAGRAGVSAMTVSRVINGGTNVRPETRRRVEQALVELDYVQNAVARGLGSSKTGSLGMLVPDIVNPFFSILVRGAETVARQAGYRLLLCNTESDLALERQYVEDMLRHRVEGLLIAPVGDRSRDNLLPLTRRQFPFVLIDRSVAGLAADVVQGDNVAAARRLMNHVIELGHQRIAVIIEPDNVSTARERLQGYREALDAAGLRFDLDLIARTSADRRGGYEAMQRIMSLDPLPTAVFSVNNMTALGAMQAIREKGLAVPKDIGLVCFDDVEHLAVLSPFLTVMNQPTETFGTVASQLLIDRIAGRTSERQRRVVLEADLIIRESCAARTA